MFYGLILTKPKGLDLVMYRDVDYTRCPKDRRSTSAFC